ncbi:MAG: hypothetical protein ABG776_09170, partial [Cyanobacteria bacterium J06555_13]
TFKKDSLPSGGLSFLVSAATLIAMLIRKNMTPDDVTAALTTQFGDSAKYAPPDAWDVETDSLRLLVISSDPWLRLMTPIVPLEEAKSFLGQMLEANFDQTQEARYAVHQGIVWGLVQYDFATLGVPMFEKAIAQLTQMKSDGISVFFNRMMEAQITQIITAAKLQGQSLEDTMKTLDRLYSEGVMGEMGQSEYQQKAMTAWRNQLERLWPTVDVSEANR